MEEIREILDSFDGYPDNTCFLSFSDHNLELVKQVRPTAAGMELDIHFQDLTEEKITACHAAGVEVNCWTVEQIPSNILE